MHYTSPLPPEEEKELRALLQVVIDNPCALTTIYSTGTKIPNPGTGIHGAYVWRLYWSSIEVRSPIGDMLFKCSDKFFKAVKTFAPPTDMSLGMGPNIQFTDITPRQVATMLLGSYIIAPTDLSQLAVKQNIIEQSLRLLEYYRVHFEKEKLQQQLPKILAPSLPLAHQKTVAKI